MIMTDDELNDLVTRITYKDGYMVRVQDRIVQVAFWRHDVFTGEYGLGYGGTAQIPEDATHGDVVRTVFGLFKALEEHECREWFRVDGVQVFSPHISYDALLEAGRHIQGHEPDLMEEGRRLASQRDDLIAQGIDPAELAIPLAPGPAGPLDPDCRAGKHAACLGRAWDEEADEQVPCGCPCHQEVAP